MKENGAENGGGFEFWLKLRLRLELGDDGSYLGSKAWLTTGHEALVEVSWKTECGSIGVGLVQRWEMGNGDGPMVELWCWLGWRNEVGAKERGYGFGRE